jgi:AmiR/NasT family two-component response regulator
MVDFEHRRRIYYARLQLIYEYLVKPLNNGQLLSQLVLLLKYRLDQDLQYQLLA